MTITKNGTTYELTTGITGKGHTCFLVLSTRKGADGRTRRNREEFDTEAEAKNWIKWS